MRLTTTAIVMSIAAATSATLVACSASGNGSTSPNAPGPAASNSPRPVATTPADSSAPDSLAPNSAEPSDGASAPGRGPDPSRSNARSHAKPGAPTSAPIVVPTTVEAPYPTPGKDPAVQTDQSSVLASLPGSSSRSCGQVGDHTDLRAGSLAAGNFQTARHDFRAGYGKTEGVQLNMYVIPQHARHLHEVHATVQPLGGGRAQTVTSTSVEQADTSRYFAVQLLVGQPGTYRFTFTTGQDRGCFIASFRA